MDSAAVLEITGGNRRASADATPAQTRRRSSADPCTMSVEDKIEYFDNCPHSPIRARVPCQKCKTLKNQLEALTTVDCYGKKLNCKVLHLNERGELEVFKTYEEISQYLVSSAVEERKLDQELEENLWKVMSAPLSRFVHYSDMGEYLRHLYEKNKFVDVTIEVDGRKFHAHRVALSCHSEYFNELFGNTDRRLPFAIRLKGVSPEAFAAFLSYIYTSIIEITSETACDLILLADYLQVKKLQQKFDAIIMKIPLKDAIAHLPKGRQGMSDNLFNALIRMVIAQFYDIIKGTDYLEIDVETLCEILDSDDLGVKCEYDVFIAALRWLTHKQEERIKYAIRVLSLIRYAYMTQEELCTCAEATSLTAGYDKFRELILVSNWLLTAKTLNRTDPFNFPKKPPRRSYDPSAEKNGASPTPTPFVSHPHTPSRILHTDTGSALNLEFNQVRHRPTPFLVETQGEDVGSHSAGPKVISAVTPSTDDKQDVDAGKFSTGVKFASTPKPTPGDIANFIFPPATPEKAKEPQINLDILVIGGFTTAAGVQCGHAGANTAEIPVNDATLRQQWLHVCNLPEPRQQHAIATLNNYIYLVGGCDPRMECTIPTRKVFKMNMQTKRWERVADMNTARMCHCVCTQSGLLYAIGGQGSNGEVLDSVECFDPKTGSWKTVASMKTGRFAAAAASFGGFIYVVGGRRQKPAGDASTVILQSVEVFDPNFNTWTNRSSLRFPRSDASLVRVKERLYLCGGLTQTVGSNMLPVSVSSIDEHIPDQDVWRHRTDMIIPRHNAAVTVSGNMIYILGGVTLPSDRVLRSIECYDTNQDMWTSGVHELPYAARWIGCAAVPSA